MLLGEMSPEAATLEVIYPNVWRVRAGREFHLIGGISYPYHTGLVAAIYPHQPYGGLIGREILSMGQPINADLRQIADREEIVISLTASENKVVESGTPIATLFSNFNIFVIPITDLFSH
jgi:hypothetical protein